MYEEADFCAALRCSLDPQSSSQSRIHAEMYLEQVVQSQEAITVIGTVLSTPTFPDEMKILTLSILHRWMKRWWTSLLRNYQVEIRNLILLLVSGCKSHLYSSKAADILKEIAEREFPQLWPSMISDLLGIWSNNNIVSQEIILRCLEFLLVDCTDSNFNGINVLNRCLQ
jgi:hypothetical protein